MTLQAVVSLGSNLGDRAANLAAGLAVLAAEYPLRASGVYETAPVGTAASPPFLNLVCILDEISRPLAVFESARRAEQRCGRRRGARFAPRTLDADVVCVGQLVSEWPPLVLPHPRAHLRAFVLAPWLELDPAARLVRHGPVAALLGALAGQPVRRCGGAPGR